MAESKKTEVSKTVADLAKQGDKKATEAETEPKKKKARKIVKYRLDVFVVNQNGNREVVESITLSSKDDCRAVKQLLIKHRPEWKEAEFIATQIVNRPGESV